MEVLTILTLGAIALGLLAVFAVVAFVAKIAFKLVILPFKIIGFIAATLLAAVLIPVAVIALPVAPAVGVVLLVVGTLIFFLLREPLAPYGTWYLILLGLTAVVVMLKAPKGLWGLFSQRFDIALFPVQRRLVRVADDGPG